MQTFSPRVSATADSRIPSNKSNTSGTHTVTGRHQSPLSQRQDRGERDKQANRLYFVFTISIALSASEPVHSNACGGNRACRAPRSSTVVSLSGFCLRNRKHRHRQEGNVQVFECANISTRRAAQLACLRYLTARSNPCASRRLSDRA